MSDEKIPTQTSSLNELLGGERPLIPDPADRKSTHGHNQDVVFRGFPPAPNVEGRNASLCSPTANNREAATVSGMACDSPVAPNVKQVDHRALQGSNAPNDFRAKAAPAAMPNQPGPRSAVGQAKLNGKLDALDAPAPASFAPNSDDAGA